MCSPWMASVWLVLKGNSYVFAHFLSQDVCCFNFTFFLIHNNLKKEAWALLWYAPPPPPGFYSGYESEDDARFSQFPSRDWLDCQPLAGACVVYIYIHIYSHTTRFHFTWRVPPTQEYMLSELKWQLYRLRNKPLTNQTLATNPLPFRVQYHWPHLAMKLGTSTLEKWSPCVNKCDISVLNSIAQHPSSNTDLLPQPPTAVSSTVTTTNNHFEVHNNEKIK